MKSVFAPLALALALAACRTETTGTSMQASVQEADDPPAFSDWSTPVRVGAPVNTAAADQAPAISKDGLSIYFTCVGCPGSAGGFDLWVSQRITTNDPWGPPQPLTAINTASLESAPFVSPDGHRLYFFSNRPGGVGANDLYVSRRRNKRDDQGWGPPENLGPGVNTAAGETQPAVVEDDATGTITLYFSSNRPGGPGGLDIYATTLQPDETFGPAVLVAELSSAASDQRPVIRKDGLELFLSSDRPGTVGGLDLWVATRVSTAAPWSTPVNLGSGLNGAVIENGPALSFDATELYFHSDRAGGLGGIDLYRSTRRKLQGPD
jgi:Tol biopolymer transport system component